MTNKEQTLIRIPNGYDQCQYAFFPGLTLCAFSPEQVVLAYETILQQFDDSAIFISQNDAETIKKYWSDMGKPTVITANSSDALMFREAFPGMHVVSLFEQFAKWNIFGSCVHDGYNLIEGEALSNKALKALLETMGATIKEGIRDDKLPLLTCDIETRNKLLSEGKDAYYALDLFFENDPEEDAEHDHENHQQPALRSPDECRAKLCDTSVQSENISDLIETLNTLFFA